MMSRYETRRRGKNKQFITQHCNPIRCNKTLLIASLEEVNTTHRVGLANGVTIFFQ